MQFNRTSSELSLFSKSGFNNPDFDFLDFWQSEIKHEQAFVNDNDLNFILDIYKKTLCRGLRTFPSNYIEELIIKLYGGQFNIERDQNEKNIYYKSNEKLREIYNNFSNFSDPWKAGVIDLKFDPEHPENEQRLFEKLIKRFGPLIASYTHLQAPIDVILPNGNDFIAQHVDFLLMFPNGKGLVIEPGNYSEGGDHAEPVQQQRDRSRDEAFRELRIQTLRPDNKDIDKKELYEEIAKELSIIGADSFLKSPKIIKNKFNINDYLFLLPSLISRIEYIFSFYFLRRGMLKKDSLRIAIIESDLAVAELALLSFLDRVSRFAQLYGIQILWPNIELFIVRMDVHSREVNDLIQIELDKLNQRGVSVKTSFLDLNEVEKEFFDLVLDVSVKTNSLNTPITSVCENFAYIRNSFKHNTEVSFSYYSMPKAIIETDDNEPILVEFLRDYFRKQEFRKGQYPVIKHILSQKNTIGLLPTSGGKSICYQLASLITPGTTLVIDPIVSLMQDQVESMKEIYRITRVFAWYAGQVGDEARAAEILVGNVMVFISPERFLIPMFRNAMRDLATANIYINYAVADEAHMVSMWGHDFRPCYLSLERHIREYTTFRNHRPVIVALTGTASTLVLIDLRRELGIEELEAVIRLPGSDRPELNYRVFHCPFNQKWQTLRNIVSPWIKQILATPNLIENAWGMIFTAYKNGPTGVYGVFSNFVQEANLYIQNRIDENSYEGLVYGMNCGKPNNLAHINDTQWTIYKSNVIRAFKKGIMRLLVGNNAVGVGLDNEHLNWVVNYQMPSSLEEYVQQCGRAGRNGQISACALIFSDNYPIQTQRWFRDEISTNQTARPHRWDDIGVVAGFHDTNFPGESIEVFGARILFREMFRVQANGEAIITEVSMVDFTTYLMQQLHKERIEVIKITRDSIEKFISYWLMLGIIKDYTKTGMEAGSVYKIFLSKATNEFLETHDEEVLHDAIIDSLCEYLGRYKPVIKEDVELKVNSIEGKRLSEKAISYLISFLYNEIERQRKVAIRTMWEYCSNPDTDSDTLRGILVSYFDRSVKFSDLLDSMIGTVPIFSKVEEILSKIESYEDADRLYWETSRLLATNVFRADFATINLFAKLFRERLAADVGPINLRFKEIIDSLHQDPQTTGNKTKIFIHGLLSSFVRLDSNENRSTEIIGRFYEILYDNYGLDYLPEVDDIPVEDSVKEILKLRILSKQLEKLLNKKVYERIIRKM